MKCLCWLAFAFALLSQRAFAADVERGKDIARHTCAACHIVVRQQRNEVADAPPFEVIARKNGSDPAALAFSLLEPHPKMNFALTRRDAADVAAYISTLAQ